MFFQTTPFDPACSLPAAMKNRTPIHKTVERKTIKVHVSELRVGMFVSELDRPWLETPFLLQGFELKTAQDVRAVQDVCEFVYVDVLSVRNLAHAPGPLPTPSPKKSASFQKEIGKAASVQDQTSGVIKGFIDNIKFGRSLDIHIAKAAVSECVSSIIRNSETLMFLTQIKHRDEYTSEHSFNVCVYSILLGRQIGLQADELEQAGVCGLLHDMGKVQIPLEVLNKESQLTQAEFAQIKLHTVYGRDILMSGRSIYSGSVDVAFGHHENLDGTGYPRGLQGHQINLYTKIVSVVDKYDAITSSRVYQQGRDHLEATKILTETAKAKIDPALTMSFISALGVYPSGSVVELTSGEVAVVIEQNPSFRLRPRIAVCRDAEKHQIPIRFVDLAEQSQDNAGRAYAIRRLHRPGAFDIDLRKFQGLMEREIW